MSASMINQPVHHSHTLRWQTTPRPNTAPETRTPAPAPTPHRTPRAPASNSTRNTIKEMTRRENGPAYYRNISQVAGGRPADLVGVGEVDGRS
ncbi:hypothetical protein BC936DRAFT_137904 [Jimgerdemannia flammicorona]|uniref:Uncharacterized protein n=1 Tax=Jimgerdemannia flammicorona TaxID=994334 RepID=A0A433DIQ5_9FUNG|nr:hypothetical protein BC936DRAFT_137904 [Jimgerdemannia flammicorona]